MFFLPEFYPGHHSDIIQTNNDNEYSGLAIILSFVRCYFHWKIRKLNRKDLTPAKQKKKKKKDKSFLKEFN